MLYCKVFFSFQSVLEPVDVSKTCWMSGSIDPDETSHSGASDLHPHCLHRSIYLGYIW